MKRTYIAFVLDRSGSMADIKTQTIDGFNEQVDVIRRDAAKGGETLMSLVTFGGGSYADSFDPTVKEVFRRASADQLEKLTAETYRPDGSTPLYDAVGYVIEQFDAEPADAETAFLVVVISDGKNNASVKWNGEQIAARVTELQKRGNWTFAYIGANQDLADVSKHLGLHQGNTRAYVASAGGTSRMYRGLTDNMTNYMSSRNIGLTAVTDFAGPEEPVVPPETPPDTK